MLYFYTEPVFFMFMEPRNRFQGMNSAGTITIPTWFQAPIYFLKIPARETKLLWYE